MDEKIETEFNGFLGASELIKIKGIGNVAWDDWQQSEIILPKTGMKYFEPTGSWLHEMQLENGLKNRKRLLEIERVDRLSQLAIAEWLPGCQKAKVTKKSGQKWENFGFEEKGKLYLLPEEALILLEMNCLELLWNGMPLSIQQAYEVLINSENSKCTLDEYRVYSQLVRWGYKLQRFHEKLSMDSKLSNTTKRIIMNPEGLWTPNTSPTLDSQILDSNDSKSTTISNNKENNDNTITVNIDKSENNTSSKIQRLGIISEEIVLGNIKLIDDSSSTKDTSQSTNQMPKWPGSRVQFNVNLMLEKNDKVDNSVDANSEVVDQCSPNNSNLKRQNSSSTEVCSAKKPRPEIIELSDDEIEEIPRPMTRMEILNTLPNMAGNSNQPVTVEIIRAYIPHGIKPSKDFYRFDRHKLLNLSQTDNMIKSNISVNPVNNINNGQNSHFYTQRSQCQAITTYNTNNGYSYRRTRYQQGVGSYIQENISHNTIHSPISGTVLQSNCVDCVSFVMGNMVRSSYCQNVQFYSSRFPHAQQRFQPYSMNYYALPNRDQYFRRNGSGGGTMSQILRGRGYRNNDRQVTDEPSQPSFIKRPNVASWSELKKKWRDESTITIEDEEPMQTDNDMDSSEVEVVEESISPLINSKSGINNLSEVYERLSVIKSAVDRTVRCRKGDLLYSLSYEVYPINQHYRKASPGMPMCRLFVINSKKEFSLDASKIQRLQQESKKIPIVIAFVSQSCISYIQPGLVNLPNLS